MQCKPVTALPSSENWTFEIKFDGYSCIAVKRGRPGVFQATTPRSGLVQRRHGTNGPMAAAHG